MHGVDPSFFEYHTSEKQAFIKQYINIRIEYISYVQNKNTTEEEFSITDKFKSTASDIVFPHSHEISTNLLNQFINNLNCEEEIQRTEALIENRKTSTATAATSAVIKKEVSMQPPNMVSLIDKWATIVV